MSDIYIVFRENGGCCYYEKHAHRAFADQKAAEDYALERTNEVKAFENEAARIGKETGLSEGKLLFVDASNPDPKVQAYRRFAKENAEILDDVRYTVAKVEFVK